MGSISNQEDSEILSIMTRSAARKYASVGAIHNKVDIKEELKIWKRWPVSVSYQIPEAPTNLADLKETVSSSLDHVMLYCKYANVLKNGGAAKLQSENVIWEVDAESSEFIDLSPYLTEEPTVVNSNNETQFTLHLSESLSNQSINIISLNDDEESGSLLLEEDCEDIETITLHSGETYILDNKSLKNTGSSTLVTLNEANNSFPSTTFPEYSLSAILNDHTYAAKLTENLLVNSYTKRVDCPQSSSTQSPLKIPDEEQELKFQTALNDLLLNTAILKCLICGETPQEVIGFLNSAN